MINSTTWYSRIDNYFISKATDPLMLQFLSHSDKQNFSRVIKDLMGPILFFFFFFFFFHIELFKKVLVSSMLLN
jgi:hypothetical protein